MTWLEQIKSEARVRLDKLGTPPFSTGDSWKYTNPARILHQPFAVQSIPTPIPWAHSRDFLEMRGKRGAEIVFVNGHYARELSDLHSVGDDIQVFSLAELAARVSDQDLLARMGAQFSQGDDGFSLLNQALASDGYVIRVRKGHTPSPYLRVIYICEGKLTPEGQPIGCHPRNFMYLEESAHLKLMECYFSWSEHEHLTNSVTDIYLANGARLEFCRLGMENHASFHVGSTRVHQQEGSSFQTTQLNFGNAVARINLSVDVEGESSLTELNGLSLLSGKRHVDQHTVVDHQVGHGTTRQHYKGILADESRAIFNGRIVIREGAQKVDARQLNNDLLLSSKAEADVVPQLQIYADDVKATHGATVGQVGGEELFYIQSRAIDPQSARRMILRGFAWEIMDKIPAGDLAQAVHEATSRAVERMILT